MPELPEVEVLVRYLQPQLLGQTIHAIRVPRARTSAPTSSAELQRALTGAVFTDVYRRAKYLCFTLRSPCAREIRLLGHLGMSGRMYLQPPDVPHPKHVAAFLDLGRQHFIFEDTRYFGRFTLDLSPLDELGPEPLANDFTAAHLHAALARSAQPVKVKLLDQSVVAGIGNIYASEALFYARISPEIPARSLNRQQAKRLWRALRFVLRKAIEAGSTLMLPEQGRQEGLFYFGGNERPSGSAEERFRVYGREGAACVRCGAPIRRVVQAARSTFFCPVCQRSKRPRRPRQSLKARNSDTRT